MKMFLKGHYAGIFVENVQILTQIILAPARPDPVQTLTGQQSPGSKPLTAQLIELPG